MSPFTLRTSGLHAMCVALQIHLGSRMAIRRMDRIWDGLLDGDGLHCVELAMLLQEEGLPAVASVGPPSRILDDCCRAYRIGWTCLVQLHPSRAEEGRRWAILWDVEGWRVRLAECTDGEDYAPLRGPLHEHLTGECVVIEAAVGGPVEVLAFALAGS